MKTIGAAQFKAQCLALLESVEPEGLIITKHGRPVARLVPYTLEPADLLGCLRDELRLHGDLLTTGSTWHAAEGES